MATATDRDVPQLLALAIVKGDNVAAKRSYVVDLVDILKTYGSVHALIEKLDGESERVPESAVKTLRPITGTECKWENDLDQWRASLKDHVPGLQR